MNFSGNIYSCKNLEIFKTVQMLKLKILKNRLNKVKKITNSQFLVILIQFKAIGSFSVDVPCISQKTGNAGFEQFSISN